MKKKIILLVASFVFLFVIIIGGVCLFFNLNSGKSGGLNVISAENISSKYDVSNEKKNTKCDGYEITYSNVYSYGGYFIFKDEGYIIINTKNMTALKINDNEYVTVYELDSNKEIIKLVEEYGVDYNLKTYLVASSKYYKIVFDSPDSLDEYNAGNIILYC